jgi:hypothetical protein
MTNGPAFEKPALRLADNANAVVAEALIPQLPYRRHVLRQIKRAPVARQPLAEIVAKDA